MVHDSRHGALFAAVLQILVFPFLFALAWGQALPQSSITALDGSGRSRHGFAPSSPLSLPGSAERLPEESDSILVTPQLFDGILPSIPNLQAGYLFSFGRSVGSGRLTLDYLLPIPVGMRSALFGEAHSEFQDFWRTVTRGANNRVDLSFGGGYRTLLDRNRLVGVNAFYDATRLGGRWHASGGGWGSRWWAGLQEMTPWISTLIGTAISSMLMFWRMLSDEGLRTSISRPDIHTNCMRAGPSFGYTPQDTNSVPEKESTAGGQARSSRPGTGCSQSDMKLPTIESMERITL